MLGWLINGNSDGSVNELRHDNAMIVANELIDFYKIDEFSRSPAVFCSNEEYGMACGSTCPSNEDSDVRKARGCMIAHKMVLEQCISQDQQRCLVLEDDVVMPDVSPTEFRQILQRNDEKSAHPPADAEVGVGDQGADLLYLGHCLDGLCTHALVWNRAGAQYALDHLNWCDEKHPIDEQLRKMCKANEFNCRYVETANRVDGAWGDGLIHQKGESMRETHL